MLRGVAAIDANTLSRADVDPPLANRSLVIDATWITAGIRPVQCRFQCIGASDRYIIEKQNCTCGGGGRRVCL